MFLTSGDVAQRNVGAASCYSIENLTDNNG